VIKMWRFGELYIECPLWLKAIVIFLQNASNITEGNEFLFDKLHSLPFVLWLSRVL